MDLRSLLGSDFGLRRGFANDACFPDAMCQRLLAINVFAELQSRQCSEGVRMFSDADDDGIELPGIVVNLAEIDQFAGFWMTLGCLVEVRLVDVAEDRDVLGSDFGQVIGAAPA